MILDAKQKTGATAHDFYGHLIKCRLNRTSQKRKDGSKVTLMEKDFSRLVELLEKCAYCNPKDFYKLLGVKQELIDAYRFDIIYNVFCEKYLIELLDAYAEASADSTSNCRRELALAVCGLLKGYEETDSLKLRRANYARDAYGRNMLIRPACVDTTKYDDPNKKQESLNRRADNVSKIDEAAFEKIADWIADEYKKRDGAWGIAKNVAIYLRAQGVPSVLPENYLPLPQYAIKSDESDDGIFTSQVDEHNSAASTPSKPTITKEPAVASDTTISNKPDEDIEFHLDYRISPYRVGVWKYDDNLSPMKSVSSAQKIKVESDVEYEIHIAAQGFHFSPEIGPENIYGRVSFGYFIHMSRMHGILHNQAYTCVKSGEEFDLELYNKENVFHLEYVPGTTSLYNTWTAKSYPMRDIFREKENVYHGTDSSIFLNTSVFGDDWTDGNMLSSLYGVISFRVKAIFDTEFSFTEMARIKGEAAWRNNIEISPGDLVELKIEYKNTGKKSERQNITIAGMLPQSLEFISGQIFPNEGTVQLEGTELKDVIDITSESLFSRGINLGTCQYGENRVVQLTVKVADNLAHKNISFLTVRAVGTVGTISNEAAAVLTVKK